MTSGPRFPAAIAAMLALGLGACQVGDDDGRVTELPRADNALTEDLVIALGQAKNYHHKADVYLSDGRPERAERALRRILEVPFPQASPEGEDVRLDARARLGKLLLGRGALEDAMAIVREGIDSAERESFFLANLYTVQGEIHEARAAKLEDGGDPEAARRARAKALESYERSIEINEALQERLMREDVP